MISAILILILCIAASFFFSGTETGFVSWSPLKVGHRASQGNVTAKWALYLMNHKDRLLSAILIGNNIANIGAVLAFNAIYQDLDLMLKIDISRIPSPESIFLTPVILLLGEMLPKSLYRIYPFRLTLKSIPVMIVIYFITYPFTWIFATFANVFQRSSKNDNQSFMTRVREEMVLVATEGSKQGLLFESANVFIENVLNINTRTVSDITVSCRDWAATRSSVVSSASVGDVMAMAGDQEEILVVDKVAQPVGSISLLDVAGAERAQKISSLIKPIPQVRTNVQLLTVLSEITTRTPHFFRVRDEYGATVGVLDRMDLFQTVFGKISPDFNPLKN